MDGIIGRGNMERKKIDWPEVISTVTIFFIVFCLGLGTIIFFHEMAHYQISMDYQCENVSLGISWSMIYVETDTTTCDSTEGFYFANSLNEIFTVWLILFWLWWCLNHIHYNQQ